MPRCCWPVLVVVAAVQLLAVLPSAVGTAGAPAERGRAVIVVPVYNEAARMPVDAFRRFARAQASRVRFLLVNDGSTDKTGQMLQALGASAPASFVVMDLRRNVGKAEAVRLGMLRAMEMLKSEEAPRSSRFVGFWDADLATPLAAVTTFLDVFAARGESLEMVFGARVGLLGRKIERHLSRHYLGRIFATLASNILGLRIYDTQCGAKIFRATDDLALALTEPFDSRWIFDVELIARLQLQRNGDIASAMPERKLLRRALPLPLRETIYEVPLDSWRDISGSKLTLKHKVRALYGLFHIWSRYGTHSPWQDWPPSQPSQPSMLLDEEEGVRDSL